MTKKVLVVVDVQNDFAKGGVLAYNYPEKNNTEAIVSKVKEFLSNGDFVIATRDTHYPNYLETLEGRNLPVAHCQFRTHGWGLVPDLKALQDAGKITVIDKETFGDLRIGNSVSTTKSSLDFDWPEIQVCGYCTSICVAATCLLLRVQFPESKITLLQDLCGDIDEASHKAALTVLRNQMIEIA